MKKSVTLFLVIILLVSCLASCDFFESKQIDETTASTGTTEPTETTKTTEHIHQWLSATGEHARICADCDEKQLIPEACNFVRESCGLPGQCTICHASDGQPPEAHDWVYVRQENDCWSTTMIYDCSKCAEQQLIHGDSVLPSHTWAEEIAGRKTTLSCTRCNESITFISEVGTFSYAQVLEEYKVGDPGVKHENFNNPEVEREGMSAIDAIIRAKFEAIVEYDTVFVAYDEESNMWCVNFYTFNIPGGDQSVYLNEKGLTCYIIYGE